MNEQDISFEPLREAILREARTVAEARLADAEAQAAEILRRARETAETYRQERLAETAAECQSEQTAILNRAELDSRRCRLLVQEDAIQTVLRAALDDTAAADAETREKSAASLLLEALAAMGDTPCTVRFNPERLPFITDEWLASHAPEGFASPLTAEADAALPDGIAVSSRDGAQSFDNTYAMRLHRLMPELRLMVIEE